MAQDTEFLETTTKQRSDLRSILPAYEKLVGLWRKESDDYRAHANDLRGAGLFEGALALEEVAFKLSERANTNLRVLGFLWKAVAE